MGREHRAQKPQERSFRALLAESKQSAKEYIAGHWRNAVTVTLTTVLCSQALFGNGVSIAFAQTMQEAEEQSTVMPLVENSATDADLVVSDDSPQQQESDGSDSATSDQDDSQVAAQPVEEGLPYDWTGQVDSLLLLSEGGLTIDMEALAEAIAASEDVVVDDDGAATEQADSVDAQSDEGEAAEAKTAAEHLRDLLPESAAGELALSFELDPAVVAEGAEAQMTVDAGDYFTVDMPEGITLADDAAFDVFQVDEEPAEEAGGEEADADGIRIATAEAVEDGAQLKVTFVEPISPLRPSGRPTRTARRLPPK
ncbi:hypothetical protein QUW40_01840 [Collinsella tanakaei]|uniref:hypothetical protein n=1 Tax=Collinsella tanakaei TaxID=626935 RepID=UPI0025A3D3BE|nr:hypothetical protein [Collinsella tanakaei]MDM8245342.1 hypothetical protein [Collinsella tanakaei]